MQTRENFVLKEVLIVSDGSTDSTISEIKRVKNRRIRVIDHRTRKGKRVRFNEIMRLNSSDILIQVDADMTFGSKKTLARLVAAFENQPNLGIACAYHVPQNVVTRAGMMALIGYQIWDKARSRLGANGTLYYCEGGLRAFSREFTKRYQIPASVPSGEDVFSYLWAIKNGFSVIAVKNAKIYFSLPATYTDYMKQMRRFIKSRDNLTAVFGEEFVNNEHSMTSSLLYRELIRAIVSNPIDGLLYVLVHGYTKMTSYTYKLLPVWDLALTTK